MWLAFQWKSFNKAVIFIVVVTSFLLFYYGYFTMQPSWISEDVYKGKQNKDPPSNYTPIPYEWTGSKGNSSRKSYVVNTSTCKIPDLNEWDDDIQMLSKKCEPADETAPKCEERPGRKWMHAQGSNLLFNYSAVKESGYSMSAIRCCYHIIERIEQSLDSYDTNADNFIKYSDKCHPIPLYDIINIEVEFIRVFCVSNSWPFFTDVVYREYFTFAQADAHAKEKISKWKSLPPNSIIPPSVVIIGLDTNSRLNSHRRLTRTLKVLENIGTVELFGYTKVAENTLPNTMAFLGGMRDVDMEAICYKNTLDSFDDCPFIWKDFDRVGYLTGTFEESPYASGFNYLKVGFVKKPTDFYYRPFSLALMKLPRETMWFGRCVGRYLSTEMLLNYVNDILRRGSDGFPVFVHSWLSVFSHHCINAVRFEDDAISKWIENMDKKNTILVFMSDHGDRHGPFRETTLGWYEDKLPAMWIYLPENVRKRFPEWNQNLQQNSRRLTSHFDLYHTFVQILNEYKTDTKFQVNIPKKIIGQSLFEPVSENRTCDNAGISSAYCACTEPEPMDVNSQDENIQRILQNSTNAAISFLRKVLPKECAQPEVKKLVSGKKLLSQSSSDVYIVSLYTNPGDFLFEVTVKARKITDNEGKAERTVFSVESLNDILRMNKITRKVTCVNNPDLERYCYCL